MKFAGLRVAVIPLLLSSFSFPWTGRPAAQDAAADQLKAGVVVEKVAKASEAETAGLSEGDIILRWSRGGSGGSLESPFDVSSIEIEQIPLGEITLTGLRGTQEKTWAWHESKSKTFPIMDWGLTTRPNLKGHLLSVYQDGLEAAGNHKVAPAVEIWQRASADAKSQHLPEWLSAWFWLRSAQAMAEANDWEQAETNCRQAVQLAAASSSGLDLLTACAYTFFRKQPDRAEKFYRQALAQAQQANSPRFKLAAILIYLGRLAADRDELDKGQELYDSALLIHEKEAPNSLTLASSYNRVAYMFQVRGELEKSEQNFELGLALREKLAPDSTSLATILQNLGDTFAMHGDLDKAEASLQRALKLWEKLQPDSSLLAGCFVDLSSVADFRGELAEAEDYLRRALVIQKRLQPRGGGTSASLNNLGLILHERGQLAEAEESFKQALAIKQERAPDSLDVAITVGNLGSLFRERGDLDEAEKYLRRDLAIVEKLAPKSINLGTAYAELGDLAMQRHDLAQAEDFYRKSLAVVEAAAPNSQHTADAFHNLGEVAWQRKDAAEAEKNYLRALEIREKLSRTSAQSAETLMALAEVAGSKQQWELAEQRFQQAFNALEGQTARLGGTEKIRAGFRARFETDYKNYVDLLIRRDKPDLAFNVLERSRARSLLETLAAARVNIREGVSSALLGQEKILKADITAKSDRRIGLLVDKHSDESIAAVDKEIKDLLDQYTQVESQIQHSSPRYAALTQPQPLLATEAQRLLDKGTTLLEYALGEERSYVLIVTADSVVAHELPKRAEIEQAARSVYDSLTARNRKVENETLAQRQMRWARAESDYPKVAGQLSKMVLAPVAAEIRGKRLLIVSDGALQYIPFAALPTPETISGTPVPLIARHEIVSLPSASILAVLRRQQNDRRVPAKTVAVLADPVFSSRDGRLSAGPRPQSSPSIPAAAATSPADEPLTRSVRDVGLELARLPFTRREAEAILSLVPSGQGMEALDFNATRAAATSRELSQFRIVHFATHGLLDSQEPELSGLVFSLVDKQGQPQSGFLALEDIYNLDLPADLVVLSACETGLGKEIKGEGLIGLTRGFMYAGASRVVASLWSVNDVATAELMRRFYQGMLRQGLPPASALRSAQRELRERTRWKSPYYWAAFQLQGDWK